MAEVMTEILKREVQVLEIDPASWKREAQESGLSSYRIDTLQKMFVYYRQFGFRGNSTVLECLLGHAPKTFREFLVEQERSRADAG
jgi:hypothetical protein